MNQSFVYCHIRNDTNEVFYIGKGNKRRVSSTRGRSGYWNNVVKKAGGFKSSIVAANLSDVEALNFESVLIKAMKDKGARLCNIIDRTGNVSGYKHTPEMREYIRQKSIGNKSRTGQKQSPEAIEKARQAHLGQKRPDQWRFNIGKSVYCITNGVTYPTQTEACKTLGLLSSGVSMCCKNKIKQTGGYQFEYA
jgi:hypothetical protein